MRGGMDCRLLAIKPFFYLYQIIVICSILGRQAKSEDLKLGRSFNLIAARLNLG
jgi:hypothetical protein